MCSKKIGIGVKKGKIADIKESGDNKINIKRNSLSLKRKATSHGGHYDNESRKTHWKEPGKNKETDSIIKTDITEEHIDLQEIDDFLDVAKKNNRSRSRVKERS